MVSCPLIDMCFADKAVGVSIFKRCKKAKRSLEVDNDQNLFRHLCSDLWYMWTSSNYALFTTSDILERAKGIPQLCYHPSEGCGLLPRQVDRGRLCCLSKEVLSRKCTWGFANLLNANA